MVVRGVLPASVSYQNALGKTAVIDEQSIFRLPVGHRSGCSAVNSFEQIVCKFLPHCT